MGSRKVGPENLVPRVFPPVATPPSREAGDVSRLMTYNDDIGGHNHAFTDADAWTRVFDDPSRDAWQHPDEVLRALELEPTMTVADVGAGTGYFSARGLSTALRPGGRLFIVDFSPAADRGPPASMRLAPEVVIAELESAGLAASLSPIAPPGQYIVEGRLRP